MSNLRDQFENECEPYTEQQETRYSKWLEAKNKELVDSLKEAKALLLRLRKQTTSKQRRAYFQRQADEMDQLINKNK